MSTSKTLQTRLQLKYDTYANWTNETLGDGKGANLVLLPGEIGICEIPSGNTSVTTAPTVLFKVGGAKYSAKDEEDGKGTEGELMKFKDLPWASAKAADVYSWTKVPDPSTITVKYTTGTGAQAVDHTSTLAAMLQSINTNAAAIATINTTIAGGVHFVGITTTKIEDGYTTAPVIIGENNHTPSLGDVVLYENKEFIWNGSAWEELGDLGRVATLETLIGGLIEENRVDNKYVTHISKDENGVLVVNKAQPAAAEVSYNDATYKTVATKIAAIDAEIVGKAAASVETDYVRYVANTDTTKPGKLVIGKTGTDMIIFNCGSATDVI